MTLMNDVEYRYLLSVEAVHERAEQMFEIAMENNAHFQVDLKKLPAIADFIIKITRANYPLTKIPLHSRWRHFEIHGENRAQFLAELPLVESVKSRLDLAVISVLLDAGAGSQWGYADRWGKRLTRSEGLAAASLDMFAAGIFSADLLQPWRVDADALQKLDDEKLAAGFQVSAENPLLGLDGRTQLLQRLGRLILENPTIFPGGRPGGIYDYIAATFGTSVSAVDLVNMLLLHINSIWPGRTVNHYALGDVWEYAPLGWAPFHKLTLWLTLSLIEPLQAANITVRHLEALPGLAEYRNGGLFVDAGVLVVRDRELLTKEHQPADPLIVEWRALTIALLERLAKLIRDTLGAKPAELPLVNILQGGTWQAGRQLAMERSTNAEPPIRYVSSGTVF